MTDEWGPWIEHDGRGCPCLGKVVEAIDRRGFRDVFIAGTVLGMFAVYIDAVSAWTWSGHSDDIILYRIRKPRGLTICEGILAGIKKPEGVA